MRRIFGIIGGVALGLILSQFPEYAQQYTQRLGGAVDELQLITSRFEADAAQSGLSTEQALASFTNSSEPVVRAHGVSTAETFERYEQLSGMLARIEGANAVERLLLIPDYFDSDIGQRTLEAYQPAVPVTVEGFAYAGAGVLVGYVLGAGLTGLVAWPFRQRRNRVRISR